jgi:catechol 2,3-dioxygenase-like lactoylglutathione lyase family enzyme
MMVSVPTRLSHVTITAADFAAGLAFYDTALGALGLARSAEYGDEEEDDAHVEAAGWSAPGTPPVLWLVVGAEPTRGAHVCLRTDGPAAVRNFYAAACAAGARPHTAPRRWTLYRRGEFGAAVYDPAGNLIEVVSAEEPG